MGPLAMMAIMAAAGAAKHQLSDKPREEAQRKYEAEKARYSGWTGMQPQNVQSADLFGNVLSGGMSGMAMGQNMEDRDNYNKFLENQQTNQMAAGGQNSWQAMNNPYQNNQNYSGTMRS